MNLKPGTVIMTFIWCIFMGVTVGSIGIGAAFPKANLISGPFVCPNGKMEVTTDRYNPVPGQTVTTLTWYCVDSKTGAQEELGIFPMVLYSGVIYGFLLFIVVFVYMLVNARRSPAQPEPVRSFRTSTPEPIVEQEGATVQTFVLEDGQMRIDIPGLKASTMDSVMRLKELKDLHEAHLITDAEFERKRAEIIREL